MSDPQAPALTPVVFHILLALRDEPRHGYAIMQAVEETGGAALATGPGTIYGSLGRLEDSGLVAAVAPEELPGEASRPRRGRPRRYFRLTPAGLSALEAEARRIERLAHLVRDRRVLPRDAGA